MKLFCCIILTAVLTGSPMASNLQAALDPAADAEWMRTVAAAKKEGKVSIFLYHRDNIETAVRVFEKSFPENFKKASQRLFSSQSLEIRSRGENIEKW
jgi:hypothetical protein